MTAVLDRPDVDVRTDSRAPARRRDLVAFVRQHWPAVVFISAFVAYLVVGLWLLAVGNYAINDALVRSSNARVILFSRDPHLAALGAVWMPLPVLVQVPVVAVLEPFGLAWASSVIYSASFTVASLALLVALGRRMGLREPLVAVLVILYGFNPVVWLWAALGMTEANFFFLAALATYFYLRWTDFVSVRDLGALGLTLGLETLTRQEGIVLAVFFATLVAIQTPRGRRAGKAVLVVLPALFTMFVWLASQQLLRGDALFWYKVASRIGRPPEDASWLPADRTVFTSLAFVFQRVVNLAPVVLLVVPLVLIEEAARWRRAGRRFVATGAGIVGAGLAIVGFLGVLLATRRLWGNPRYFLGIVLLSVMAVMWLLRPGGRFASRGWAMAAIVVLAASGITGIVYESNERATAVEREHIAVDRLLGRIPPGSLDDELSNNAIATYKRVAEIIDERSRPGDLAALDSELGFTALLYAEHLDRFAIPEDRDFEQLVALPESRFRFLVLTYGNQGTPANFNDDFERFMADPPEGQTWQLVEKISGFASVYELTDRPAAPPTPTGGTDS